MSLLQNQVVRRIEAGRDETKYTVLTEEDSHKPKISVLVPAYNSDPLLFRECIESVFRQIYPNWELIVSDDHSDSFEHQRMLQWVEKQAEGIPQRVVIVRGDENVGLGENLNRAFAQATGEFVCVLDHDDMLLRTSLCDVAEAVSTQQESKDDICVLYTEELAMVIEKDGPYGYKVAEPPSTVVKWPFDEMTFMQAQYVNHLCVVRKDIVSAVGGWSGSFDGSQDYDFLLRCVYELNRRAEEEAKKGEKPKGRIKFIPHVGYIWTRHVSSFSGDIDRVTLCNVRAQRAIQEFADVRGWNVDVMPGHIYGNYHLRPRIDRNAAMAPLSVVIPCGGDAQLLYTCIRGIIHATTAPSLSLVIVAGPSEKGRRHMNEIYDELPETFARFCDVRVVRHQMTRDTFNFSRACNIGVANCSSENILFLNTDLILARGWYEEALGWISRPEVGVVGLQLWDKPDGTINHAGIGIVKGLPEQLFRGMTNDSRWPSFTRNVLAVTGAALLTKRSVFHEIGMFDEHYHQYFQDVAYCLKVRAKGLAVIYTSYAKGLHAERATFGSEHDHGIMVHDLEYLKEQFDLDYLERTDTLSHFIARMSGRVLRGVM